jgi:hypothetical protein
MVKGLLQAYFLTFPQYHPPFYIRTPLSHPRINALFNDLCPPGLGSKQADYYSIIRLLFQYNEEILCGQQLINFSPDQRRQFHTYFDEFANVVAYFTLPSTKELDLTSLVSLSTYFINLPFNSFIYAPAYSNNTYSRIIRALQNFMPIIWLLALQALHNFTNFPVAPTGVLLLLCHLVTLWSIL